ncbi:MAG: hypothetical protein AAGC81_16215 [Pseudomonadota bacterium]
MKLAVLLSLLAGPVLAETMALPDNYAPQERLDAFRECRAAVLVEQEYRGLTPPALSDQTIDVMQEQISFILAESVFNTPLLSIEDGFNRNAYVERWFLEFGISVREKLSEIEPVETRRARLQDCQAVLWTILKVQIDLLLKQRAQTFPKIIPHPGQAKE